MRPDSIYSLMHFIEEREAIRLRRAAGAPKPWTEDPILREWSFTNVRREDDRVTRWVAANWREPHSADPDLWFAMAVARFVNWPDTMAELGYPVPWDREHFNAVMEGRAARGEKVWGDAYNISNGGKRVPKAEHVAGVLDRLWQSRKTLRPRTGERLAEYHGRLKQRPGPFAHRARCVNNYLRGYGSISIRHTSAARRISSRIQSSRPCSRHGS